MSEQDNIHNPFSSIISAEERHAGAQGVLAALDSSALVLVTDRQGKILYVNDKVCRTSGFEPKELLGKRFASFRSGQHSKEFYQQLWQTVWGGETWQGEISQQSKDGRVFWVSAVIVPFQNGALRFAVVAHDITHQKEMEEDFRALPQRMIEVQELERTRISKEIHDDLGQSLATFKMLIQSTLHGAMVNHDMRIGTVNKIIKYLNTIIEKSRNLTSVLRPSTLEVLGLTASIRSLIDDCRHYSGLTIISRIAQLDDVVLEGEAINLYRVVQEALANVINHARASHVSIVLFRGKKSLTLTVRDDGVGFDDAHRIKQSTDPYGLGMSTMAERAKLLGGKFRIDSRPGKGTLIRVKVPMAVKRGAK